MLRDRVRRRRARRSLGVIAPLAEEDAAHLASALILLKARPHVLRRTRTPLIA